MIDPDAIYDIVRGLEDPEELLTDLLEAIVEAIESTYFDDVEVILADLAELHATQTLSNERISWREFVDGEAEELEPEEED